MRIIHRMNNRGGALCGATGSVYVSHSGADGAVTCPDCKGGPMSSNAIEQAAAHFREKYGTEAVRHILPCGCHEVAGRIVHLCIDCELARVR